jgi:hypothetical protein
LISTPGYLQRLWFVSVFQIGPHVPQMYAGGVRWWVGTGRQLASSLSAWRSMQDCHHGLVKSTNYAVLHKIAAQAEL